MPTKKLAKNKDTDKDGRPRKDAIFKEERESILKTILDVSAINNNNDSFFINDIDNDITKQNQILMLEEDENKWYFITK